MTTSKKNFLLEFSDITEAEASGIIKLVRHPNIKDQANTNNNFHATVLAFFYRKRKGENDIFYYFIRTNILYLFSFFLRLTFN